MKIKRITEYGQPTSPGTYWIILKMGEDEEKDAAGWDGEVWRYTDRAADHLWGEPYGMPVLAWIDELDASPASGSPVFRQEFMGEWVSPRPPAKVSDISYNHLTGHCSPVAEALPRCDGRIYATLQSGIKCVLPSPLWEYRENDQGDTTTPVQ